MRKVLVSTLEKKLKTWQKRLKLDSWNIKIVYKHCGKSNAARVEYCEPVEKTAIVAICPTYYNREGYNISWTLESLIVHELLHIEMWKEVEALPAAVKSRKKFQEFEEYLCDRYAKIIVDMNKRRS